MSYMPHEALVKSTQPAATDSPDIRAPELWVDTATAPTVLQHINLSGLGNDEHSAYLNRSGVRPMTGALAMGSNKITGLGTPTATTDAATKTYVDSTALLKTGGTATGNITITTSGYSYYWLESTGANQAHFVSETINQQSNGLLMTTTSTPRWYVNKTADNETGVDKIGSNFAIARYTNAGAFIDNPLTINRDTGEVDLKTGLAQPFIQYTRTIALSAAAWTRFGPTGYTGLTQTGGFTWDANQINVPRPGLYLMNMRGISASAGRFIHTFGADSTTQSGNYFMDDRGYTANSIIAGSGFIWLDAYVTPFLYHTVANSPTVIVELAFYSGKKPV